MWVRREGEVFLGRDCLTTQRLSSETLEDLDATVRQLIERATALRGT
jgi:ATP-dependent Zn protease